LLPSAAKLAIVAVVAVPYRVVEDLQVDHDAIACREAMDGELPWLASTRDNSLEVNIYRNLSVVCALVFTGTDVQPWKSPLTRTPERVITVATLLRKGGVGHSKTIGDAEALCCNADATEDRSSLIYYGSKIFRKRKTMSRKGRRDNLQRVNDNSPNG
jgi:hypothetical protein